MLDPEFHDLCAESAEKARDHHAEMAERSTLRMAHALVYGSGGVAVWPTGSREPPPLRFYQPMAGEGQRSWEQRLRRYAQEDAERRGEPERC